MKTDCEACLRQAGNCGGHWRRVVIPRNKTTRGKVSLDNYDGYGPASMESAYDRDSWDPDQ